ncbi:MAG TPA: polysaccharide lyase family protein [Fimbriimonadaceae bacterium]|nr:polysaccharide lyase family protein [Fimbriimonadaceae bacterium]
MIAILCCAIGMVQGSGSQTLWQIGAPDGTDAEFGLAPDRYRLYRDDPTYVVGLSRPDSWPYVLPGPDDAWAGSRGHRDTVWFGLSGPGTGAFVCDFVETHYASPPRLTLWINGRQVAAWQAPKGNGDDAMEGHPEKGKHAQWKVEIPDGFLKSGVNELEVRNESGSWVVFDAIQLLGAASMATTPVPPSLRVEPLGQEQIVRRTPNGPRQEVSLQVTNLGPAGTLRIGSDAAWSGEMQTGTRTISLSVPAVKKPRKLNLSLSLGSLGAKAAVDVAPVRPWTVYLLPHSHVDIGYTDLQTVVAAMHRRNLFDAMSVARESAAFPPDSRYRFNMEATWILDNLLRDGTPDEIRHVGEAFRNGIIDSSGNYCNVLTGLMRPEELMRSYGYSDRLRSWLGVDLTTATQTDVPGVTWGAVEAMSQAGIKNLVLMPNTADRIGGVLSAWQDKPFFWVSPSGLDKVFVWETASYGVAHGLRHFNGDRTKIFRTADPTQNFIEGYVFGRLKQLASENYPYDAIAFPWSGTDNFPVDADVPYAARHWNETYVTPHVVVATVDQACDAFLRKYRTKVPVVKGDFTPYWEDGAGSSAKETAMNRASADRLVQAETLSAMTRPVAYDGKSFWRAWSDVILYSEHTWGAYNSVSDPDSPFVKAQWAIKQGFAVQADKASRALLAKFAGGPVKNRFTVVNTSSWQRTDLVLLTPEQSQAGDRVVDANGHPVPSQRLRSRELAVLARNVPPFGSVRLRVVPGAAYSDETASAFDGGLASPDWQIRVDPITCRITRLWNTRLKQDFAKPPYDLNRYVYVRGSDVLGATGSRDLRYEIVERGPLVASLRITSSGDGVRLIRQDVRLVAGLDRVDFIDQIEKVAVRKKEAVHFAFPFLVPNGRLRIQGPWAVIRPDLDQIAGSNKNWFTTQYFADVSNSKYGVTWSSLDAPLMEVGGITAAMTDGGYDPKEWIQHLGPTQTLYSWALNNHWYTNYRAEQEGHLTFRYSILAHGPYAPDAAYRFGAGLAQPLIVSSVSSAPLLQIGDPRVVVSALKPSEDKKALIVRLWCVGDKPVKTALTWRDGLVGKVSFSDSSERPLRPCGATLSLGGWQVATLRAELRTTPARAARQVAQDKAAPGRRTPYPARARC